LLGKRTEFSSNFLLIEKMCEFSEEKEQLQLKRILDKLKLEPV
jgi:hypothetical protein